MGTDPTPPPAPPPAPEPGIAAGGGDEYRFLLAALNELPQRVFWRGTDGRYLGCNRAFAEDAGLERPEQIVGRADADLPWPAGPIRALRADDAALLSGEAPEAIAVEATGSARSGERWLEIRQAPLRDQSGAIVGVVGTYADGAARRIAEARLRALSETVHRRNRLETLGALTGGVAQEFRHLLGSISRHAAAAANRPGADGELAADLEQIRSAAERASALTLRLLNLNRQQLTAPTELDPREEMVELLSLIRPLFGEQIDLRLDDAHEPPGPVHADRAELQQALLNLCLNARDAMAAGEGGRLTLAARRIPAAAPADGGPSGAPSGEFVRFEVSDTGPGIPGSIRDRVFDPFVTTKPPGRGTGLGMAIVRSVAEQHGGRVTLETAPTGTNVGLELPAASAAPAVSKLAGAGGAGRSALRALVVDDRLSERLVTVRGLTKQGFECRTAENGRQALELLDGGLECDVVVTDLQMPELNGRALCLELLERPRRPGLIVLSGSLDARLHEGLEALGVDRLFFKPMGSRELARAAADVVAARAGSSPPPRSASRVP